MGVVSNWEDWLEALLVSLEVHHYFDFLIVSATVRSEKPDPAIFHAALARAGVRPRGGPARGDSLHADVGRQGLRDSGGAARPPGALHRRRGGGATIIRSLDDLPPLLDKEEHEPARPG